MCLISFETIIKTLIRNDIADINKEFKIPEMDNYSFRTLPITMDNLLKMKIHKLDDMMFAYLLVYDFDKYPYFSNKTIIDPNTLNNDKIKKTYEKYRVLFL